MKTNTQALLALSLIDRLGVQKIKIILEHFPDIENIFGKTAHEIQQKTAFKPELVKKILTANTSEIFIKELEDLHQNQVNVISINDPEYPSLLKEIYDPPTILYLKGKLEWEAQLLIGIVGPRKATYYGKSQTKEIIKNLSQLAANIVIVSGLALGIDTTAHQAALEFGVPTIAVLGSGLNQIYPSQNQTLSDNITENGCLISEFSINTRPLSGNFPLRNRIISGLSSGTLVAEAGEKSGALITAQCALEHNRELFAFPGPLGTKFSYGTNKLIQQGCAKLVMTAQDLLDEFEYLPKNEIISSIKATDDHLNDIEQMVLNELEKSPLTIDELTIILKRPVAKTLALLTGLEMKEKIVSKIGGVYQLI